MLQSTGSAKSRTRLSDSATKDHPGEQEGAVLSVVSDLQSVAHELLWMGMPKMSFGSEMGAEENSENKLFRRSSFR